MPATDGLAKTKLTGIHFFTACYTDDNNMGLGLQGFNQRKLQSCQNKNKTHIHKCVLVLTAYLRPRMIKLTIHPYFLVLNIGLIRNFVVFYNPVLGKGMLHCLSTNIWEPTRCNCGAYSLYSVICIYSVFSNIYNIC